MSRVEPVDVTVAPSADSPASPLAVKGDLHLPEGPHRHGLVLTHGAGANCNAPLLVKLAEAFAAAGVAVLRCDLPFRQKRPSGPPPRGAAETDRPGLRAAVAYLRERCSGSVFLGGHSYGGRQSSILASEEPALTDGVLLLSYPLHPPKKREELRTAHFPQLRTAALFIHGTRDGFGDVAEMESALQLIPARTRLEVIPASGHELMTKRNEDTLPGVIVKAFSEFFEPSGLSRELRS